VEQSAHWPAQGRHGPGGGPTVLFGNEPLACVEIDMIPACGQRLIGAHAGQQQDLEAEAQPQAGAGFVGQLKALVSRFQLIHKGGGEALGGRGNLRARHDRLLVRRLW